MIVDIQISESDERAEKNRVEKEHGTKIKINIKVKSRKVLQGENIFNGTERLFV